jgi:L-malate glycosyltransferase
VPTRVLHCLSAIASGGVERRHLEIVRGLPAPHFAHSFVGTVGGGPIVEELRACGVTVTLLGEVRSVLSPGRYLDTVRLVRRWKPHLIHGAVMEGSVLGAVAGLLTQVPVITEETSDPRDRRPMGRNLARIAYLSSRCCIAVSPAVGRHLVNELRLPSSRVRVITNGVAAPRPPTPASTRSQRERLGVGASDVVIGTVSRLYNSPKRVTDLIAAFSIVASRDDRVHLLVVGDGPDRQIMEAAGRATGFGSRVHFVGSSVPADDFYAVMDVFALASSHEAFGLAAAEAMRAGLPVVATEVGGLAEVVVDGETGYLVPPFRPSELAASLAHLVTSSGLRNQMGAAGRKRADDLYSLERYLGEIEDVYREVMALVYGSAST